LEIGRLVRFATIAEQQQIAKLWLMKLGSTDGQGDSRGKRRTGELSS
jgi:hypothetical protein